MANELQKPNSRRLCVDCSSLGLERSTGRVMVDRSFSRVSAVRKFVLAGVYVIARHTLALWGIAAAALFLALAIWYLVTPSVLRVAAVTGPDQRILQALAEITGRTNSLSLRIITYSNFQSAAKALENGEVDAATVQPDVYFPRNAATVAILREEHLIIIGSAQTDELSKLAGKRLGIIGRDQADFELIDKVSRHYEFREAGTRLVQITVEQLLTEPASLRTDALVFLATPGSSALRSLLTAASTTIGSDMNVISLQGVDAMLRASPSLSESTLQAGSLRARPQLPKEDVKTFSTTSRLVASAELDRTVVSRLTEQLFQKRQWIAQTVPEANFLRAPPDEGAMTARLPNHRGAVDYVNREQQTFMDQYGDWLWLSLFAAGGASSLVGWLVQLLASKQQEALDGVLGWLLNILKAARESRSLDELMRLTLEADELVAKAVQQTRKRATSTTAMSGC
jgi:TRAP-type uncharacterized transport system substrate-binding protein